MLESEAVPGRFYVGLTDDLSARLAKHNAGGIRHTAKSRPWRIKSATAFSGSRKRRSIREVPQVSVRSRIRQKTALNHLHSASCWRAVPNAKQKQNRVIGSPSAVRHRLTSAFLQYRFSACLLRFRYPLAARS